MTNEGLLLVISGPSGVGKGTVIKALNEANDVVLSVSATTRQPRDGETNGKSYYFKSVDQFKEMIENDDLIEWVQYCDNYYGTPKKYIYDNIKMGNSIILEIDVNGALNVKKKLPECVLIFIVPPSYEELERRIRGRATEKEDTIIKRLEKAKKELTFIDKYDYIVLNDDIQNAKSKIFNIIMAEKLKTNRNMQIIEKYK